MNIAELINYLKSQSKDNQISFFVEQEASLRFNIPLRDVEFIALNEGIMPIRYIRNNNTFSINDQIRFHQSHVTVVGCGGLGGYVIEQLVRLGIGTIRIVDHDTFEEHNLNRQLLSNIMLIGKPKVTAVKERASQINPVVIIEDLFLRLDNDNASKILEGTEVVVDALDSIKSRLLLVNKCKEYGIPLVHGSIGGYYGQISTQLPGDELLQHLFDGRTDKGIEVELGNPAFTPVFVSSIQVIETINIILNRPCRLQNTLLYADLSELSIKKLTY